MTPTTTLVVATVVGLVAVAHPVWRVSRGWVTLAHELGHAVTAMAAEARVRRIRIHLDTSGLTEWSGTSTRRRLPRGVVAWWGHPAPGALAVAVAAGLAAGHAVLVAQVVAVAVAVATVVWVRNPWGAVVGTSLVVVAGGGAALGATASLGACAAVAVLWSVGGLRAAADAMRGAGRAVGSDAAVLSEVLWLPAGFWAGSMAVVSALAVAGTAVLLWTAAG